MKCHKCGYNSFEFLDSCKKCGAELATFKKTHRIVPVILGVLSTGAPGAESPPPETPAAGAAAVTVTPEAEPQAIAPDHDAYKDFSLGFPEPAAAASSDTPFAGFSFDEDPAPTAQQPAATAPEEPSLLTDFSFDEDEAAAPLWDTGETDTIDMVSFPDEPIADDESANELPQSMDNFFFDADPAEEDPFAASEAPASTAKKPEFNLENFDKEFEMIFADSEPADKEH